MGWQGQHRALPGVQQWAAGFLKLTSYSLKGTRITRAQVIQKGLYKRSSSSVQRLRGLCEAQWDCLPAKHVLISCTYHFRPCTELRSPFWTMVCTFRGHRKRLINKTRPLDF